MTFGWPNILFLAAAGAIVLVVANNPNLPKKLRVLGKISGIGMLSIALLKIAGRLLS